MEIPHESIQDIIDHTLAPCVTKQDQSVCSACLRQGMEMAYRLGFTDAKKEFDQSHRAAIEKKHS